MPTALIFGGSGEIGAAVCKAFTQQGYAIAFTYYKNKKRAEKLEQELRKLSTTPPMALYCDVASEQSIQAIFQMPIYFDTVVNCVGTALYKELLETTLVDFQNCITENLQSTFLITKYAIEKMLARSIEGSIVHVSSIWGSVGASCESIYAATKGGVHAFTKSIAKEMSTAKIRINAIAAGMIKGKMNAHFSKEELQAFYKNAPIATIGVAEDIAATALFLANNRYITGEIVTVDGGVTLL